MKYLIKRYHKINSDNDVSCYNEIIESELDTKELADSLTSKAKPVKIEIYKLVAEKF